jgi:Skp family chaperone for outer membrane proteins
MRAFVSRNYVEVLRDCVYQVKRLRFSLRLHHIVFAADQIILLNHPQEITMKKLMTAFFLIAAVAAFSRYADAQVPVQTTPAKVGVINSDTFTDPKEGITRLVNALRTIETEFKPKQDELSGMIARFDQLKREINAPVQPDPRALATKTEQAGNLQVEIKRKQEDARVAYAKRLSALTDPIRLSIYTALEAFAKQRQIDLLVDLAKFPDGLFLVNKNADLTAAFIRDYNSKNP